MFAFIFLLFLLMNKTQGYSASEENLRARSHSVLSFGDSWAYGNYYALQHVLQKQSMNNVQVLFSG